MHFFHRALALLTASTAVLAPLGAQSTPVQPSTPATTAGGALTLAPFKRGDRFFNSDATGALYVRDGLGGKPRLLLPAGGYSDVAPSNDGNFIAYTIPGSGASGAGSDLRVRSVVTSRDLPDLLHNAAISRKPWTHNEKGFFYTREDLANHRQRVYYHSLGKPESRDAIVLSQFDEPDWRYSTTVSDDGHFAVFTISHAIDAHTRIYFIDLDNPGSPKIDAPVVHLVDAFGARYEFVDNAGTYFFLQTDRDAPRGSVVLANIDVTRVSSWPIIVPQAPDSLMYVRTAGDQFVLAVYRSAGENVARVYGPPDPAAMRAEFRKRLDSLKKERAEGQRNNTHENQDALATMRLRAPAAIRLELAADFPRPTGASILAMNTVADNEEVFYTLRMADGSTRSFLYNVKNKRNEPFPPTPQAR